MAKPVIASDDMMEDFKKNLVIVRIPEDPLPLISPAGNMIDCAWKRYTQRASHKSTISLQGPDVKKLDLTPFMTGINYRPMGQRFRLKADFDISHFSPEVQVILRALKKYGMILADNGSSWYISGVPDPGWNNDVLVSELRQVKGSDFEAIDESSLMVNADSGQAIQTNPAPSPPGNLRIISSP